MRIILKYTIIEVIIMLLCCGLVNTSLASNMLDFEESTDTIRNPERGFYKLVQVELSKDNENMEKFEEEIRDIEAEDTDVSIISFQLNLKNYVTDTKINNKKIQEIQKYFDIMREHGYKVIFRVVYDSQGEENPEPEFDQILKHIDILKSIYTNNEDILYLVEAGYLGSYGEWHSGRYDDSKEYRNKIIEKLLEVVPSSITINLRRPSFIKDYTTEELNEDNAFSGSDISRLGLHNDGYLASETDYGTFEIEEREESLLYQHNLTKYTLFGGEATNSKSEYNNFENAIKDMEYRNCSYLNKTYDREVKEKWKRAIYHSKTDVYSGQDGLKYVGDHLGYRFVLREVNLTNEGCRQNISLKLENTGFGNIINSKEIEIIYKRGNETYTSKIDTDIRRDLSKEENISNLNYSVELPKDINEGEYEVYLKICEPYESLKHDVKYSIRFANNNIWNEELGANYIGNIVIDKNAVSEIEENRDVPIWSEKSDYIRTILTIVLVIAVLLIILIFVYRHCIK